MFQSEQLFGRVDAVGVVEAAYADAESTDQWLAGVLESVGSGIEHVASIASLVRDGDPPSLGNIIAGHGLAPTAFADSINSLDFARYMQQWRNNPLSMASAYATTVAELHSTGVLSGHDIQPSDYLAFSAFDPEGDAIVLSFALPRVMTPTIQEQRRAGKLAAHISAGLRLRKRSNATDSAGVDGAAAILDPGGKILHAQGDIKGKVAAESLRQAARRIDRARTKAGRADADAALDAWQGLVSGRWSLVDVFEQGGRRLLVARENEPEPRPEARLSPRERQVVAYAVMGQSQKLIAYTLGLSIASVSAHLTSACRKLGVASRVQLAAVLGWGKPMEPAGGVGTAS